MAGDAKLFRWIRYLRAEKRRLDYMIALLDGTVSAPAGWERTQPELKKRGRKSMDPAERMAVAERMRKYWEGRRQA